MRPFLLIFGGLPGVGKTTIARALARRLRAAYLRVDSLEHAFSASDVVAGRDIGPAGYMAAAAVAADNLRNSLAVVADSVNPLPVTREIWRGAAGRAAAAFFEIEVVCSNPAEHRQRVETRAVDIPGFSPPSWSMVENRDYDPWPEADLRIDTAAADAGQAVATALAAVRSRFESGGDEAGGEI